MKKRILRGGSYFSDERDTRSAYRNGRRPGFRYHDFGLRLGLDTAQSSRAIRGGAWIDSKRLARSAVHASIKSSYRNGDTGLRLALDTSIER